MSGPKSMKWIYTAVDRPSFTYALMILLMVAQNQVEESGNLPYNTTKNRMLGLIPGAISSSIHATETLTITPPKTGQHSFIA